MLVDERPILFPPSLAVLLGDGDKAAIVQTLHWWIENHGHEHEGRRWIYNTLPEWQAQFPWMSERTVRRKLAELQAGGWVLTGVFNKIKIDRTIWYTIDYDKLKAAGLKVHIPMWPKWTDASGQSGQTNTRDKSDNENTSGTSGQSGHMDVAKLTEVMKLCFPGLNRLDIGKAVKMWTENPKPVDQIATAHANLVAMWKGKEYTVTPASLHRNWDRALAGPRVRRNERDTTAPGYFDGFGDEDE